MGTSNVYISHRCDLRCSYCFERRRTGDIEPSVLRKALDFIFHWDAGGGHYLFGGEPFLRPDLIELSLKQAMEQDKFLGIMTHGRHLHKEVLKMLEPFRHHFALVISVDSQGEAKDWNLTAPYIEAARSRGLFMTLQFTIHPQNVARIFETGRSLLKFAGHGCQINLRKICESWRFSSEDLAVLRDQCLELNELALRQGIRIGLPCKISGETPLEQTPCCCTRMDAGEVLTIDIDGKIYDCECFLEIQQNSLGDVEQGIVHESQLPEISLTPTSCHFHCYSGNEEFNEKALELDRIVRRRTRAFHFLKEGTRNA